MTGREKPASSASTYQLPAKAPSLLVLLGAGKLPTALTFGMVKDLLGRPLFLDQALVEEDDVAGNVACKIHLMSDEHHGSAVLLI